MLAGGTGLHLHQQQELWQSSSRAQTGWCRERSLCGPCALSIIYSQQLQLDPQTPTKQLTQRGLPSLEGDLPALFYLLQMIFSQTLCFILCLFPFLPTS